MSPRGPRFVPLVAILLVGCGGGGARPSAVNQAVGLKGNYTGSYTLATNARGTADGAVVLDIAANGEADGSLIVTGTVYDFKGRVGSDGLLSAQGEGIVVRAELQPTDSGTMRTLSGLLTLSGEVVVQNARAALTQVAATT